MDAAIKWYDQAIKEFPGTTASRIAYEEKMKTLIGWKEIGRDGEKFGDKDNFSKYMPLLLDTFYSFEKEHPNTSTLQAFRYQIAQAYWNISN